MSVCPIEADSELLDSLVRSDGDRDYGGVVSIAAPSTSSLLTWDLARLDPISSTDANPAWQVLDVSGLDFGTSQPSDLQSPVEVGSAPVSAMTSLGVAVSDENSTIAKMVAEPPIRLICPIVSSDDGVGTISIGVVDYLPVLPEDYSGRYAQPAGDMNGDGFDDVLVTSYAYADGTYTSSTFVVFGNGADGTLPDASQIDGTNGFLIQGMSSDTAPMVTAAGDVNGDGFADLIVNDYADDGSSVSYIVFGRLEGSAPAIDASKIDGTNGFKLTASSIQQFDSFWVDTAGDVNGDGFTDLQMTVWSYADDGSYSNTVYIVLGKQDGFVAETDVATMSGADGYVVATDHWAEDIPIIYDPIPIQDERPSICVGIDVKPMPLNSVPIVTCWLY